MTTVLVNPDAWQDDADGVHAVIPVVGITASTLAFVVPDSEDGSVVHRCGLEDRCLTENGTVILYARIAPSDAIYFTILAVRPQNVEQDIEVTEPDAPTIAYYKIPVASKDTLGGVKIGDNIEVTEDGTISAKGAAGCNHVLSGGIADGSHHIHSDDCFRDFVADPEDVMDALHRALGIDTEPVEEPQPADAATDVSQH